MIPENLDYRYDRRVDPFFLQFFTSHGAFRTLREYALKARYPVDLQFRSNLKTGAQHASLYVGLTTVLDVHWKPDLVRLAAHRRYHSAGFDPTWTSWAPVSTAQARSEAVDDYLDAVIPEAAAGRAAVEGSVQAAVSSFDSGQRAMLDREVMLHFRDTSTRKSVMDSVSVDLLRSLDNAPVPGARPKSFGGKCDLLALDSDGRLLAVEVKPKGVSTIVWAPAQAIVYARLLHLWTRNDPLAAEIISGMISQRQELHLLASRTPRPVPMPEVLPVVAVQRGMSQKHRERLFAVRRHLRERGIEEAARLQIYEVTLAGRLLNADRGR
jgi:hypothetical protein